jgi:hypothetical protein
MGFNCKYGSGSFPDPVIRHLPYPRPSSYFNRVLVAWGFSDDWWSVEEDWYITLPNGVKIVIPKGSLSNGASFPRILRIFFPTAGLFFYAGFVHDFAFRHDKLIGVRYNEDGSEERYDYMPGAGRLYWDNMFKCLVSAFCGLKLLPYMFHSAMVCCTWPAWKMYRKAEQNG